MSGCWQAAAVKRYAWREAYDDLQAADASGALSAEDLEGLADAALWTGRLGACIDVNERWDALWTAGRPRGLRPAGYRAVDSLRLEKGIGTGAPT